MSRVSAFLIAHCYPTPHSNHRWLSMCPATTSNPGRCRGKQSPAGTCRPEPGEARSMLRCSCGQSGICNRPHRPGRCRPSKTIRRQRLSMERRHAPRSGVASNNGYDGADQAEVGPMSPECMLVHSLFVPLETGARPAGSNVVRGRGIGTSTARAATESIVSSSHMTTVTSSSDWPRSGD